MKDLYRRNGLRPRESNPIRIHNSDGDEEDREAAFTILLNPAKKAEYDRVHKTLSSIGYVRRHLGLAGKSRWRLRYGDFLIPSQPRVTRPVNGSTEPRSRVRWPRLLTRAAVILLWFAILFLAYKAPSL